MSAAPGSGAPRARSKFPLHLHISLLLVILVLAISTTLGLASYRAISELILGATEQLFQEIPREVEKTFEQRYRPVNAALAVLADTRLAEAPDFASRMDYLEILARVIGLEPQIAGIQVGYANGDYFILRPLRDPHSFEIFEAPLDASYMVDHISDRNGEKFQQRLFLDDQLHILSRLDQGPSGYDPRRRPWFVAAMDGEDRNHVTSPYRFYFLQTYGVTTSRASVESGSVLAVDITLAGLSQTLAAHTVSPSTFALLVNQEQEVVAHTGLGTRFGESEISTLGSLAHPLVRQLTAAVGENQGVVRLQTTQGDWLGASETLATAADYKLTLLVAAPEVELFAVALELRRDIVLLTLLILALALPVAWIAAAKLARPLRDLAARAASIANLEFAGDMGGDSPIREVDELMNSMQVMTSTISNFLNLINSLSGEPDIDRLLGTVTEETMVASGADAAVAYLLDDDGGHLRPCASSIRASGVGDSGEEPAPLQPAGLDLAAVDPDLAGQFDKGEVALIQAQRNDQRHPALAGLCDYFDQDELSLIMLPLRDRQQDSRGVLFLIFRDDTELSAQRIGFSSALSGFAAVSMESGQLLKMQKKLLQAFIELIAGAIDAKSPYTGGHCQRVPALTHMLAEAACDSTRGQFADFDLSEDEWEALRIASWLHDCGKVTTPEYVVDKSTKLETLYDRIHEVRMRFEVLKRDAEIRYWEAIASGGDRDELAARLLSEQQQLDADFAFVAGCNQGDEFLSDEAIGRLQRIGGQVWRRTLDDRLGVSWEEDQRKRRVSAAKLPVEEHLLADKPEHLFERRHGERMADDNPWGFKVDTPEYKFNRGELYNLSVRRGTLSHEERFTINDHMVQTIIMLNQLPFSRHLKDVPEIAGGHHEKMDGTGYPRRLHRGDMSLTARMMAIADIFEALTAADRPYKKAKTLGESIAIMEKMVAEDHIDADLFQLFIEAGVHRKYAAKFLAPEQLDG